MEIKNYVRELRKKTKKQKTKSNKNTRKMIRLTWRKMLRNEAQRNSSEK